MSPTRPLLHALFAGALLVALTSGCATSHSQKPPPDFRPGPKAETYVLGLGPDDIEHCATKITESLQQLQEFKDPTLQPYILVQVPELNVQDRLLVMDAPIFTDRLITYLMKVQGRRARFISREDAERVMKERRMKQDGTVNGPADGEILGADFFLLSKISEFRRNTLDGKVVNYMLCSFRLVDAQTTEMIWKDDYQTTKKAKLDAANR